MILHVTLTLHIATGRMCQNYMFGKVGINVRCSDLEYTRGIVMLNLTDQ